MAEPMSIQTLLTYLTLISVPVGVFYHIMTLRNTRRNQELTLKAQEHALETRQAQLLMQVYNRWSSFDHLQHEVEINQWEWEDFDEFWAKYGPDNPRAFTAWSAVGCFYEGLGVLVKNGLLDPRLVDDLISGWVISHWERFEPIYLAVRDRFNSPTSAEYTEYIYNQIKPIWEEQHPELDDSSKHVSS